MLEYVPGKAGHFVGGRAGGFEVRRMLSSCYDDAPHRAACRALRHAQLRRGAVAVLAALQQEHGRLDRRELAGDVPPAEARVEPGVAPATERHVDPRVV